jgi:hypothetical protein
MTARRRWLVILLMTVAVSLVALAALFRPLDRATGFHVPSRAEATAARNLFARAQLGTLDRALIDEAGALGFAVRREEGGGLAIDEANGACQGRGAYLVRAPGPGLLPVAITAPHRGADRHTGPIAQALLAEHRFAAGAWNSAPRRPGEQCEAAGDLARLDHHYFTSFAAAFAGRFPQGRLVQLHGFDQGRWGTSADMILSDGTRKPGARLLDLADCLTRALPDRAILVYGIDADMLGGETNAQGKALRQLRHAGFTHIEMAEPLRAALAAEPGLRAALAGCLAR